MADQAAPLGSRGREQALRRSVQPPVRPATLVVAWERVKQNRGSKTAGVDGETRKRIEQTGVENVLSELIRSLRDGSYAPLPVRERKIPKRGSGKVRSLGIPALRDRIVQMAAKLVLEPIFEADFCSDRVDWLDDAALVRGARRVGDRKGAGHRVETVRAVRDENFRVFADRLGSGERKHHHHAAPRHVIAVDSLTSRRRGRIRASPAHPDIGRLERGAVAVFFEQQRHAHPFSGEASELLGLDIGAARDRPLLVGREKK